MFECKLAYYPVTKDDTSSKPGQEIPKGFYEEEENQIYLLKKIHSSRWSRYAKQKKNH